MYRTAFIGLILAILATFIVGYRYNPLPYLLDTPSKVLDFILTGPGHSKSGRPSHFKGSDEHVEPGPSRRIVAIGDLHGDLPNTLKVLEFAGIINDQQDWIATNTTLVQVGDVVDRGPDTKAIYGLLRRLSNDSSAYGSDVVGVLGNHEIMNMFGDLRYVNPKDTDSFGGPEQRKLEWSRGGDLGSVHWANKGIHFINHSARQSLFQQSEKDAQSNPVFGGEGPTWYREYAQADEKTICPQLKEALNTLGARRMVIGHTPQLDGIKSRCRGRVIIIDTGISSVYGGKLSALEIFGDSATALYEKGKKVKLPKSRPIV
ncbi:hypothetical protein SeMB42_g00708 [Synchytrium endobioticum]|uniref:Calcineurin-like phosphoesterase domain-containing protein n=1 Tax=Synchytrium endobioticum TaxID=286115 RepID=A0A507D7A9_9FUNG|nr:hypothetical protein SeLEV6574_g02649 [Synchytrium endobioticum]TPX53551.1 hypothetical protein SeMB42_g00708 [Synchytrium endobioticum]